MKVVIGIDPGVNTGLAIADGGRLRCWWLWGILYDQKEYDQ